MKDHSMASTTASTAVASAGSAATGLDVDTDIDITVIVMVDMRVDSVVVSGEGSEVGSEAVDMKDKISCSLESSGLKLKTSEGPQLMKNRFRATKDYIKEYDPFLCDMHVKVTHFLVENLTK